MNNEQNTPKVTRVRNLALALNRGPVNMQIIGKACAKRVELWIAQGAVKAEAGYLILA